MLGIHIGPSLNAVVPDRVMRGTTQTVQVDGFGLQADTSVSIVPSAGLTIVSVNVDPGGTALSFELNVDSEAVPGLRSLRLVAADGRRVPERSPGAGALLIEDQQPQIESIEPVVVAVGDTLELLIRGRNLRGLPFGRMLPEQPQVLIHPADDLDIGANPAANNEGTEVRVPLGIGAGAAIGPRVVQVVTASGASTPQTTANNTLQIVAGGIQYLEPFVSAALGVQVGQAAPGVSELFSPPLEVVLGPAITGFTPTFVEPGQSLNLEVIGHQLTQATELRLIPDDGISIVAPSFSATANSASVDIVVAADAPLESRRVELLVGGIVVAARDLLEVRSQPPIVTALTPNWLFRDQSSQTIAIQGVHFSQVVGARLIPDDQLIIEELTVLSDTAANLRLRTLPGAQLGPRVVQLQGLSEGSSAIPSPENTLQIVDRTQLVTPVLAPPLGVTIQASVPAPERTVVSPAVGILRGSSAIEVAPETAPRGEVVSVTVTGFGLASVDAVQVESNDGLLIDGLAVAASGESVAFELTVAADATLGPRRVVLLTETTPVRFADPAQALIEVVEGQPDGPIANPDGYQGVSNAALVVGSAEGVLLNDIDPLGGTLFAVLRALPQFGTLNLSADGAFVYQPDADFAGQDRFEYSAGAGQQVGAATIVTLSVVEPHDARDDSYSTLDSAALTVDGLSGVLSNDVINAGSSASAEVVSMPALGTLALQADGGFSYVPNGSAGTDSFRYRIRSDVGASLPATVTITVIGVNDPPAAVDDQYVIERDTSLQLAAPGVLVNDSDPDGDPLIARALAPPTAGSLSLSSDGALSYTPPTGFVGTASFTYEIADPSGLVDQAIVTIDVNDSLAPVADSYSMDEGEVLFVDAPGLLANDVVVAQGAVQILISDAPDHGTLIADHDGSFIYTPVNADWSGTDQFSYQLRDNVTTSPSALVTILVRPVNDPPLATTDRYLTDENVDLVVVAPGVLANDLDVDSDVLSAVLLVPPEHGLLTLRTDGSFNYVPEVNYRGLDTFRYTLEDGDGGSAEGEVRIDVTQPPTATNDVYLVDVDTPLEITDPDLGLLINDHDAPERDPLTAVLVEPPAHGQLSLNEDGTFLFVPELGYQGLDVFTYRASDGLSLSNFGTVTLAIGITSLPRAEPDEYIALEDTDLVVPASEGVLANDTDADTPPEQLQAFLVGVDFQPLTNRGVDVTLNLDGSFSFRPWPGFSGETFFIYEVFDGTSASNAAIVSLTVEPVNDGVRCEDDFYGVLRNTVFEPLGARSQVSFNDEYDPEFPVEFSIEQQGQFGFAEINPQTGRFRYTPQQNFAGTDQVVYRVTQVDTGIFDTAIVTLRVNGPPVAGDDFYNLTEDTLQDAIPTPLANDVDPDGDPIAYTSDRFIGRNGPVWLRVDDRQNPTTTTLEPTSDFYGSAYIEYYITDGTVLQVKGRIDVEVAGVPDAPRGLQDKYLTQRNTQLVVGSPADGVLNNDWDPDTRPGPGHNPWAAATGIDLLPITAELNAPPSNGSLSFTALGTFTYTPNADYSGLDTFTYRGLDATGRYSDPVTAQIRVNTPPTPVDDAYVVNEDTTLIVPAAEGLLANDLDVDGDTLRAGSSSSGCAPCFGSVSIFQSGAFEYTPDENFNGQDEFFYRVSDPFGGINVGRVAISVLPVNDAPVTEPDTYRGMEDEVLVAFTPQGILRNDREVDGEQLTNAQVVIPAAHGSVSVEVDGAFTYTPDPDFNGRDEFGYRVYDESNLFTDEMVEVLLTAVNDAPQANPDSYQTSQDQSLIVSAAEGVLANDSDVDGPTLIAALIGPAQHGLVQLDPDGAFSYQPDGLFSGVDQFQYQVDDGLGEVASATVSIVVEEVGSTVTVTVADDFYAFDAPGVSVSAPGVLANDSVSGAPALTASLVLPPSHGSVNLSADGGFSYTANPGFSGADGFTYAASADGVSELARVDLDVRAVANLPPIANGEQFGMVEDGVLDSAFVGGLLANDSDFEGAVLSLILETNVSNGQLSVQSDGEFVYAPDQNFNGIDQFSYRVSDGQLLSQPATATINVFAQNDPPVASDDLYQGPAQQNLIVDANSGLLSNDSDVDGDTLQVELVDSPLHGQVQVQPDGAFQYQPAPEFAGTDRFRYAATDQLALDLAEVTIQINAAVNQPPVAQGETFQINEDQELSSAAVGPLTANDSDPDGDPLSVVVTVAPVNGALVVNAQAFNYQPSANYHGADQFSYRVSDGDLQSNEVVAEITIMPVNDPPLVQTDMYQLVQGQLLSVPAAQGVLSNDSDIEGDLLTSQLSAPTAHGTLSLQPDGAFDYLPDSQFHGRDEFAYLADDGTDTTLGRAVIDVTQSPNQRPVAVGEQFLLPEDTVLDTRDLDSLLANDFDPEGQPLTLHILTAPSLGVLEQFDGGHVRYTPARDSHGSFVIEYEVSDGELSSLPVQVEITLQPVNDPPTANADVYVVPDGADLTVAAAQGVLTNDSDPDTDTLVATVVVPPAQGQLNLGLDGSLNYLPPNPRPAQESFRYRVADPSGAAAEAQVDLLMNATPPPDPIFANGYESLNP